MIKLPPWEPFYIGFLIILILYLSTAKNNNITDIETFDDTGLSTQVQLQVDNNNNEQSIQQIKADTKKTLMERYIEYKQKEYTNILKETKDVLDTLGIPFFLSSGTCLGYFREGKFIDHDYDIDIGIFEQDWNNDVIDKMNEKGLKLYRVLGDRKNGMELSFKKSGSKLGRFAKIDIFLHYLEKDNDKPHYCWYTYKYPDFKEKIKYCVSKFDLEPVNFMGLRVNVPNPTLTYILEHYGDEWNIPKRAGVDYFYATSPKSIVA